MTQTTIFGGQVGSETLRAGETITITVVVGSGCVVERFSSGQRVQTLPISSTTTLGPYASDQVFRVSAYTGSTVVLGTSAIATDLESSVSGDGPRTLTLETATANSIICELPDGRVLGTSYDVTGQYGGQLWVGSGALAALTRTAITTTRTSTLSSVAGVATSGPIQNAWPLPNGDFLFMSQDGSVRAFLFYAKAGGGTWSVGNNAPDYNNGRAVMDVGSRGGTHTSSIKFLHERGLALVKLAGADVILGAEYNVNISRTSGGANDHVRIVRSDDLGKTWSTWIEWNTSGTNMIRHFHAVRQDPVTGWVYFCAGDEPFSSIIRWDGVSAALPNNTPLNQVGNYPGWQVLAHNEYHRCGDLLFSATGAHYLIDNSITGGLETFSPAMSVSRFGPLASVTGARVITGRRDPLIGIATPDGGGFWFSMWNKVLGNPTPGFDVWSSPDLKNWSRIGVIRELGGSSATAMILPTVFWCKNRIVVTQLASEASSALVPNSFGGSLIFRADTQWDGVHRNLT